MRCARRSSWSKRKGSRRAGSGTAETIVALVARLEALGLELLAAAPGERLWTLNAVRVPAGVDEAAVRRRLLDSYSIEIGAGLGPLAGKIWRVGLMGSGPPPRTSSDF